jgi:hypothetical protein
VKSKERLVVFELSQKTIDISSGFGILFMEIYTWHSFSGRITGPLLNYLNNFWEAPMAGGGEGRTFKIRLIEIVRTIG